MAADALAPFVAQASAAMVLTILVLICHEQGVQLHVPALFRNSEKLLKAQAYSYVCRNKFRTTSNIADMHPWVRWFILSIYITARRAHLYDEHLVPYNRKKLIRP